MLSDKQGLGARTTSAVGRKGGVGMLTEQPKIPATPGGQPTTPVDPITPVQQIIGQGAFENR